MNTLAILLFTLSYLSTTIYLAHKIAKEHGRADEWTSVTFQLLRQSLLVFIIVAVAYYILLSI